MTETSSTQQRTASEPGGAGLGVWILSSFIALLALAISIAALAVALSHQTKTSASSTGAAHAPVATNGDTVALREYNVNVVPPTPSPGNHTFTIANDGRTEHELLVFQTSLAPSAFPIGPDGDINEEAAGLNKISDGDNIAPGGTQKRTVDLSQPGTYVFVCNLPGHFKAGMFQVVTVK